MKVFWVRYLTLGLRFDEVSNENESYIGENITSLSSDYNRKNIIILTSRNQGHIPRIINSTTGMFKPLSLKQIKSLIMKYDEYEGIEVGKELIAHDNFKKLDYSLFETPLMVNLLYKSFGYNRTIDDNIVTFYDEMFNALYKGHDLTKDGFARKKLSNLNYENFKQLFNAFCFVSLYDNKASFKTKTELINVLEKAKKLSSVDINNLEDFFQDLLEGVPLLIKDGLEYKFIHKTIMEFFGAEFLCYSEINQDLFKKIVDNNLFSSFSKAFDFLYEINKSLYIKEIGSIFLKDFINVSQNKYAKYNEYFKTILFFNNQFRITVSDNEDFNPTNDFVSLVAPIPLTTIKNKKYILFVELVITNHYSYLPKQFINNIQDDTYKIDLLIAEDKEATEEILSIITLEKYYKVTSKEIFQLQKNDIIITILLYLTFEFVRKDKGKSSCIDIEKCKKLLSQNENKISILDQ